MPIGISDEHEALRQSARRFLETHCPPSVPRALLDADEETRPPFWPALAGLGWTGLHLPEAHGGQGYGVVELAVVLEELGRAAAPGPFLPTVLAGALICEAATDDQQAEWLTAIVRGTPWAVAFGCEPLTGTLEGDGLQVRGTVRPVLGGGLAERAIVPVVAGGEEQWVVLDDVRATPLKSADATRRVAAIEVDDVVPPARRLTGLSRARVLDLAAILLSAEAAGAAGWCIETASSYAKVREQFGRPIGQFQAVKHRCADMLIAVESAVGTAWDAARAADDPNEAPLAAALAASTAPEAAFRCAKDCVQILGGIGFTWEHDAHVFLKRSIAVRQLLGGASRWHRRAADLALTGARRSITVELPTEAGSIRAEVRAAAESLKALDRDERRARMVDGGWLVPHWPEPWGRDAGPLEQLVIDEEFRRARVSRPNLGIGAWAAPTIVAHGTIEQQERWVRPTLMGELSWCQLFSEPGAGSDLASLSTKAVRTDGGWLLSGQKVWTSLARQADWGICLARTNPDTPKHLGITYFLVDMHSEGLDIRPLRELTGEAMFNEVFLSDVFVPDECVVGEVDGGWPLARTTLANERVAMSSGSSFGGGVEAVLGVVQARGLTDDAVVLDEVGRLLAEATSVALLGVRITLRALTGAKPGPESSVRKLLGAEHDQRVQQFGLELLGPEGATLEGEAGGWSFGFLANRCLTIAGGTSEVQRNVIAERLLGLPRDP